MTRRLLTFFGLPMAAQTVVPMPPNTTGIATTGQPPTHDEAVLKAVGLLSEEAEKQKQINAKVAEILEDLRDSLAYILRKRKPANGECPVCGTMAEKYEAALCANFVIGEIAPCDTKRLVDCAHCRNAFWQDAEVAR